MTDKIEAESATTKLYAAMEAFATELNKWDGEEEQARVVAEMADYKLTPEARANTVFQLLTTGHTVSNGLELTKESKIFAMTLAETMGPDWAQWLYNFTKLVTKLA